MSCHELRPYITALADESLEPELVSRVQEHLAGCPSCTEFYYQQLELAQWFKTSGVQLDPPGEIWKAIEARIEEEDRPGWSLVRLLQLSTLRYAATGLAFLVLFSVALLRTGQPDVAKQQILSELESYHLEVRGNPFWPAVRRISTFPELGQERDGNPFDRVENLK